MRIESDTQIRPLEQLSTNIAVALSLGANAPNGVSLTGRISNAFML